VLSVNLSVGRQHEQHLVGWSGNDCFWNKNLALVLEDYNTHLPFMPSQKFTYLLSNH